MDRAERIAQALGNNKKTPGGYLCNCPCHEDRRASLSVAVTSKGGIALNCFAGCDWEEILEEIKRRGLLEEPKRAPEYKPVSPKSEVSQTIPEMSKQSAPQAQSAKPMRKNKYDGAKFYTYRDLVGNILCRKVKLPDKKMWFERFEQSGNGDLSGNEHYRAGLNGLVVPLYNLEAVVASDLVYLCEGEKDAETLITRGLTATTNHAGAKSWAAHLSEQLKNKTVIIIPDNDEAGKKRVNIISKALNGIAKEIRVFVPDGVKEKGDITDWVENGGDVSQILPKSIVVEKKKPNTKATREEYFTLIEDVLGGGENGRGVRRCIFNDKLMYYDEKTELWNPAINALEILKSEALFRNETRESKFAVSAIQSHFFVLEAQKDPEFLVDIPAWDNEDRIGMMADLVILKPKAGITRESFRELLKEWCARVFLRMADPMIQNRILVLQGGQGIGKDTWTSMLVDGLGQFCLPLALVKEDKDTYLSLHRGLIMKISEFDKTAKTEISTLKDIITAPSTNLRAPYDKDSKVRLARCSFISSANVENLLRDYTGNRRFLIFEIESIEYAYHGWSRDKIKDWQLQCLAQMQQLAAENYKASAESWAGMHDYISDSTPTDPAEDLKERFISKLKNDGSLELQTRSPGADYLELELNADKTASIFAELARESGLKYRGVKSMLTQKLGVQRRIGDSRFRVLRVDMDLLRNDPKRILPQSNNTIEAASVNDPQSALL